VVLQPRRFFAVFFKKAAAGAGKASAARQKLQTINRGKPEKTMTESAKRRKKQ